MRNLYCSLWTAFIFLSVSLFSSSGEAQDKTAKDNSKSYNIDGFWLSEMDSVEITGNRQVKSILKSDLLITVSDIKEITARDLGDLLTRFQGIDITTGGKKANKEIKLRGMNSRAVAVSLDGRPLNTGYYGKVDFNDLPFYGITGIQIIKGPAPARYGINNYSGVVDIKTSGEMPEKFSGSGSLETGNGGFYRLRAEAESRLYKNLFVFANIGHRIQEGFPMSASYDGSAISDNNNAPNSAFSHTEGQFKILKKAINYEGGLDLSMYKGSREFPFQTVSFPEIKRFSPALYFKGFGNFGRLRTDIFMDTYYDRYQEKSPAGSVTMDSELWCKSQGISLGFDRPLLFFHLYAGGGIKKTS
jgi:outer membrane receptor protein involved in Fe transport